MPGKLRQLIDKIADARERHRERHRPTGFGFAFADGVSYLDGARWDASTAGSSFFVQCHIGFDRDASGGLPLYLRLLHAAVADAITLGCRRLSLGRTALEPKARLGARPEPMQVWLRHRTPAMNVLLRNLVGAIPHDEAPVCRPFKNQDDG